MAWCSLAATCWKSSRLDDSLLIEAKVRPQDVAFLHPGQKAMVKFTAYDYTIYGGLKANLELISADTITDKEGNSFYLIQVRTEKSHLGSDEAPAADHSRHGRQRGHYYRREKRSRLPAQASTQGPLRSHARTLNRTVACQHIAHDAHPTCHDYVGRVCSPIASICPSIKHLKGFEQRIETGRSLDVFSALTIASMVDKAPGIGALRRR